MCTFLGTYKIVATLGIDISLADPEAHLSVLFRRRQLLQSLSYTSVAMLGIRQGPGTSTRGMSFARLRGRLKLCGLCGTDQHLF